MMPTPEGWTGHPVFRRGQQVGTFFVQDNEIHCYRLDNAAGAWLTRQDLERLTAPIFARFGHLVTKVRKSNAAGQRFVTRLGFAATGSDDHNIHYRTERLRHARL
ncbi:MAG: hypothetical protein JWR74_3188 [Polaromonas sp.]|nr:hypothetical protein [Polaromonas sp.]